MALLSHHRHRIRCSSSSPPPPESSSSSSSTTELPIFPLPLVLFPGAILPLQIFEFRYRIMMHTLLHSDLRFGVLFSSQSSAAASIGCVAEVVKHEKLADDRFFLIAKGQERFRISAITRTKPYLVAEVTWLEDRPPDDVAGLDLDPLASEVETLMRDVIRISNRLNGKKKAAAAEMTAEEGEAELATEAATSSSSPAKGLGLGLGLRKLGEKRKGKQQQRPPPTGSSAASEALEELRRQTREAVRGLESTAAAAGPVPTGGNPDGMVAI